MLEPSKQSKVYPLDSAEVYQPVRRTFTHPVTGERTSMSLERIYWDHLEAWSDKTGHTWVEIVHALMSVVPGNARNKSSYLRVMIFNYFSSYTISHD